MIENGSIILLKGLACGVAALGFAVLFNVPRRNLYFIGVGGIITGVVKYTVMVLTAFTIVHASFLASLAAGTYCIFAARMRGEPQLIFAVPSVIPLVPGVYAYRTMLGFIRLSGDLGEGYSRTLSETVRNGAVTLFIVIAFSLGIILTIQIGKKLQDQYIKKGTAGG